MEKKRLTKIHITGSVGSGKTTLARHLSVQLNCPYYELDNVVWRRGADGDIRRSVEERNMLLEQIISTDNWIVEGTHLGWVNPSFDKADLIIWLDPGYMVRRYRIVKRFIKQKWGLEKANYYPDFKMLKKMFQWTTQYEKVNKTKLSKTLKPFHKKAAFVRGQKDLAGALERNEQFIFDK